MKQSGPQEDDPRANCDPRQAADSEPWHLRSAAVNKRRKQMKGFVRAHRAQGSDSVVRPCPSLTRAGGSARGLRLIDWRKCWGATY